MWPLLDHLGATQAHYFGYSMGAWIGFGLAKHAPERIRSLALGGITPYSQNMAPYREMLKADLNTCAALLEQAAGAPLSDKQQRLFYQNDIQALRAAYHEDRPDISAILPAISAPCLLFAGEADPLHPLVKRCAAELPQATFRSIPSLNHIQLGLHLERMLPHFSRFLAEVDQLPAFLASGLIQPTGRSGL
jgi:pimeloyl-ACP methyl ester carboxylesterase